MNGSYCEIMSTVTMSASEGKSVRHAVRSGKNERAESQPSRLRTNGQQQQQQRQQDRRKNDVFCELNTSNRRKWRDSADRRYLPRHFTYSTYQGYRLTRSYPCPRRNERVTLAMLQRQAPDPPRMSLLKTPEYPLQLVPRLVQWHDIYLNTCLRWHNRDHVVYTR